MAKLRYAKRARADLEEIAVYVAQDSPVRARILVARIRERCERLKRWPTRGTPHPELAPDIRSFTVTKFIVYYHVVDDGRTVEILRIIDGRRDVFKAFFSSLVAPELV